MGAFTQRVGGRLARQGMSRARRYCMYGGSILYGYKGGGSHVQHDGDNPDQAHHDQLWQVLEQGLLAVTFPLLRRVSTL